MNDHRMEPDAGWLRRFRSNVRRWYARHARSLPWRETSDPYRIWISEIMLQQTTVAAVKPYYARFLKRFPSVRDLAEAGEEEVLRMWEGLGYYSRGRNLHRTAGRIVAEHDGEFPRDVAELQRLPGIGRYTAGAIASFAFDRRAPIVEANTQRLYCRLLGVRGDPRSSDGQKLLWDFAAQILPRSQPGHFNQALMDLGATVCTPDAPDCPRCPLRSCCRAFAEGAQAEIPRSSVRVEITPLIEASVAVSRRGHYLLRRCADGERWAGLWDFPRFELYGESLAEERSTRITPALRRSLQDGVRNMTGVESEIVQFLRQIRHSVTRYRIRLLCYTAGHRGGRLRGRRENYRWVRPADFESLPLSVTGRKLAKLLLDGC
jgi:A/G-specific adenine glycosylase